MQTKQKDTITPSSLHVGWANCDITPPALPVFIAGQFHARISEGVDDPLSATALALESGHDQVIFVSCDMVCVPDALKDAVRKKLAVDPNGLDPRKIIFNATHTHTGPEVRETPAIGSTSTNAPGIELNATPVGEYADFLADQLVACIRSAWRARQPGKVAYGSDFAVVGRNRRWVDEDGKSTMYRLMTSQQARERFSHIEGYEDHSLYVLSTYDMEGELTGLLINVPSPSQESEMSFRLSADFWCETRHELKTRLNKDDLFILPQCSAAGDQTSHLIYDIAAHTRMLELRKHSARQDIACRIADAVERVLPAITPTASNELLLEHRVHDVDLPLNKLDKKDFDEANREAEKFRETLETELAKLEQTPDARDQPRWYVQVTRANRALKRELRVAGSYEAQCAGKELTRSFEVHVLRLGDIAFASNPFEYYLDFGLQIKVRSPFIQTFLVQLAGEGTYVPSPRSVKGGGYGSIPASTPVGPEGGRKLAEHTLESLSELFDGASEDPSV